MCEKVSFLVFNVVTHWHSRVSADNELTDGWSLRRFTLGSISPCKILIVMW